MRNPATRGNSGFRLTWRTGRWIHCLMGLEAGVAAEPEFDPATSQSKACTAQSLQFGLSLHWTNFFPICLCLLLSLSLSRSTFGLGPTIWSAATGSWWIGPVKSRLLWFHWSAPLVSRSNWPDHGSESESGSGPLAEHVRLQSLSVRLSLSRALITQICSISRRRRSLFRKTSITGT